MKEYSLSLFPSGKLDRELSAVIGELSKQYGFPPFEPHITVIGDLEGEKDVLLAAAEDLAASARPFRIRCTGLDKGDGSDYFHCVFVQVEKSRELADFYREACGALGVSPGEYQPHISLAYGIRREREREEALERIKIHWQPQDFLVESVSLVHSSSELPVGEWKRIREFPFRQ